MVYYKPDIEIGEDRDLKSEALIIGRNIRRLRIGKGMSAKELAERIGMKKSTISNYENARSVPKPKTIQKIAEVLDVSVDAIVGLTSRTLRSPGFAYVDGLIPYFDDISHCVFPNVTPDAAFPYIAELCDESSFIVKIGSDVFEDLNVYEGSLVLFSSRGELAPNKILAVNIDDKAYWARIEAVDAENIKIRIYEDDECSYIKTIPLENDTVFGIAMIYTALI